MVDNANLQDLNCKKVHLLSAIFLNIKSLSTAKCIFIKNTVATYMLFNVFFKPYYYFNSSNFI
jgi:hypothetical protein